MASGPMPASNPPTSTVSTPRTGLLDLPVELVDRTFALCIQRDLLSLACVSRWISEIAMALLYRHPRIDDLGQAEGFVSAVSARVDRGSWMRSLTIDGSDYSFPDLVDTLFIMRGLRSDGFRNLRTLCVIAEDWRDGYHVDLVEVVFLAYKLPSLKILVARNICFGYDGDGPGIVCSQSSTVEIRFGDCNGCSPSCPLANLCATFPNASDLHLDIGHFVDDIQDGEYDAFEAMCRLRKLTISGRCDENKFWLESWRHRPDTLRSFDINAKCASDDGSIFEHFEAPLPMITRLEVVISDEEDADDLAIKAADALDRGAFPNIQSISFPTGRVSDEAMTRLNDALANVGLDGEWYTSGEEEEGDEVPDAEPEVESEDPKVKANGIVSGRMILRL